MLGWDTAKKDGTFIGRAGPFDDVPGGKKVASPDGPGCMPDILLPVAGPSGEGALLGRQSQQQQDRLALGRYRRLREPRGVLLGHTYFGW
ncbi:MAG: hypothetical protein R2703_01430 [Micropruina glycogenica]